MIGLTITSDAAAVLDRLRIGQAEANAALVREVHQGAIRIQSRTKRTYLSGHALRRITGRLSRSIHVSGPSITRGAGGRMKSVQANVGTNVEYAAYHEFGFHGAQKVRAFTRQTNTVFGRKLNHKITQYVAPFTRAVNYGGHPFLRPAATDEYPGIRTRIRAAIERAFGGQSYG